MKPLTEETLNLIWGLAPTENAEALGVDMVDVPGDDGSTAVRECLSDVEHVLTVYGSPRTYDDHNNTSNSARYTRLRSHTEEPWERWTLPNWA
jgi:hypothetical protein